MMQTGYQTAIDLAKTILQMLSIDDVCANKGAKWSGGAYSVPWFGEYRAVDSGSPIEQVLWLHYLIAEFGRIPTGKLIAYRDIRGAAFYESKFIARAVRPIVKCFGANPQALRDIGTLLGGHAANAGDTAVTISPLPNLPITYILWTGDDEFPPEGNILFDETAPSWLDAEDLVVLASLGAYRLVSEFKKRADQTK